MRRPPIHGPKVAPHAAGQRHRSAAHMNVHTLRNGRVRVERLPGVGEDLRVGTIGGSVRHGSALLVDR